MDNVNLSICCPYQDNINEIELNFILKPKSDHKFFIAECLNCEKKCNFTTWNIEPHTAIKIEMLKNYLNSWFPKLLKYNHVLYLEPFSGPGKYINETLGSPTTAINSYINYIDKPHIKGKAYFVLVEKNSATANMLRSEIKKIQKITPNIYIEICEGDYLKEIDELIETSLEKLPPTFIFIDPFGLSTLPFPQLGQLLKKKSCEAMIHLMFQYINRFIHESKIDSNLELLFGSIEIVEEIRMKIKHTKTPEDRFNLIKNKYIEAIKTNTGAKYVLPFVIKDNNNSKFSILFFVSNHIEGLKKMKSVMWKIDSTGNFEFSDYEESKKNLPEEKEEKLQITLFDAKEYAPKPEDKEKILFDKLKKYIYENFKGEKDISYSQIEKYVLEETIYLDTHIIKHALKPLMNECKLEKEHPKKNNYTEASYTFM